MKNSTWNPTRRNRNIGTAKSGHSANNEMTIPAKWRGYRIYWERLTNPVVWPIRVSMNDITLLIEAPRAGSVHACTPHDIEEVLKLLPREHLMEISTIVLRQPTKKQQLLNPVWGRYVYYADIGKFSGPGIHLEAVPENKIMTWGKKLSPFYQKELKALEADGHIIADTGKAFRIESNLHSCRSTQLFRTLPHEVGHAVDFLQSVEAPSLDVNTAAEEEYIRATFRAKPSLDKEEFANRYAREFFARHQATGLLPFKRIERPDRLQPAGIDPAWFGITSC